jgi:hypothetical protein
MSVYCCPSSVEQPSRLGEIACSCCTTRSKSACWLWEFCGQKFRGFMGVSWTGGAETFIVACRCQTELTSNFNALLFFPKCQFRLSTKL